MNRLQAFGVGAETVADWLGAGGIPADSSIAEHRAKTCALGDRDQDGKPCSCRYNEPGTRWDQFAAETVSIIMAQRRAKFALGLKIPSEDQLHFCALCHCKLETKVFVPMSHIAAHAPESLWKQLPPWCWMVKERPI